MGNKRASIDSESKGQRAPRRVGGYLAAYPATPLERVLRQILPLPIRGADVVALFENRTTAGTIRQWRYGRRTMPEWAVIILQDRISKANSAAEMLKAGPGPRYFNLSGYLANR